MVECTRLASQQIRFCPRCLIRVPVTPGAGAEDSRCAQCRRLLCPSDAEDVLIESLRAPEPDPSRAFGKYTILGELGKGGVGIVSKAWDPLLNRLVALKRIRRPGPGEPRELFDFRCRSLLSEARHAVGLRHPGIVTIFDVGQVGDEYYISMEYLPGETLQSLLQAAKEAGHRSLYFQDPRRALSLLAEVARAAHYAHTRPSPIIHCDLKPANILVDGEGRAHILDFGLSRDLDAQAGEAGEICGTPSYMAPEQAAGRSEEIDARTDVYGLGAILYEMLAGVPPFLGEALEVIRRTIQEHPPRPGRARRSGHSTGSLLRIPPRLEALCMKSLEKEMARRPSSLEEVAEALEEMVRPPSPPSGAATGILRSVLRALRLAF